MPKSNYTGKAAKNISGPKDKGGQTGNSNGVRQRHNMGTKGLKSAKK